MPRMLAVIVVLATAGLGACSGEGRRPVPETVTVAAEPGPPWVSAVRRHHSLAGRIWRPSENAFVDRHEVLAALAKSPFVLVGENTTTSITTPSRPGCWPGSWPEGGAPPSPSRC